jgi:hypothetical protein
MSKNYISNEITPFNHAELFRNEIEPLLEEVKSLCSKNKIPFFYEFVLSNDIDGISYSRGVLTPRPMGLTLADNTILQHSLIARGFQAVPPGEIQELDISDFDDTESEITEVSDD